MLTGSTPSRNIFWIYRVFTWLSRLLANSERSRILALVLSESWSLFPSDNSIYDRKISKRTKELRDPTYYYHKFHGRKGHQHGRQPNLEMPVTSRENQEYLWYIPPRSCAFHTSYFTPNFSYVYFHAKYFYPWWRCSSELNYYFKFQQSKASFELYFSFWPF